MTNQVNQILTYVFASLAVLLAALGYFQRPRRNALWIAAGCAAAAAGSAYFDSFWAMAVLGIFTIWALLAATNLIDFSWRMRAGLVVSLALVAILSMWPTLGDMTGGKLPCPDYLCAPRAELPPRVNMKLGRGLDLRGGLRLVYTVDVDEAIRDRRDRYYEEMRAVLATSYGLQSANQAPTEEVLKQLREKVVVEAPRQPANQLILTFTDLADVEARIDARFRDHFRADLGNPEVNGNRAIYTVREAAASEIRDTAVAQAKEIVLRRVDELGLKEAAVSTRSEDIIVEVPGEDERSFAEIRDVISQTARLEFKLLDDDLDFFGPVKNDLEKKGAAWPLEGLEFQRERVPSGVDENGDRIVKVITFAYLPIPKTEEPKVTLERLKEWVGSLQLPPDREVGYGLEYETIDEVTLKQGPAGWRTYFLKSRAEITGDMLRDARAQPDQSKGSLGGWNVGLVFTEQGGSVFGKITTANVKKRFAIILDNKVESAPEILTAITGGHAQITMGSSDPEIQLRDSRKLEMVLRSGALPAPISPSNEQRIGPSLGKDAIDLSVQGAAVGAFLVLVFMLAYYEYAGLISAVSVMLNVFLQLAILASLGASMTLPGIAGIALTMGMGVDANVLQNERVRDELRDGKSPRAAVSIGFDRALSAIVDGNLTTIISALVLAQYGTGPIKGFAYTLMVGTTVNIFCGVFVSRVLFDLYVRTMGRKAKFRVG
ncbi:MAG: protein translocase subunit SecD [Polyangiaceae bacterium]|nr:protein translocase subunit SecD [Polyangiaceae bacterium]